MVYLNLICYRNAKDLYLNYTKISILLKVDYKIPFFIGSQIRGALGYALKKVTCINPSYMCDGCFATHDCLYYSFYEQKNHFHKYRLDFELGRNYYDFSIYLFHDVCIKTPYVVSALHMMLTKNGLGKERRTFDNFEIFINDKYSYKEGKIELPKNFIKSFQTPQAQKNIIIKLITPLRIKKNNRFLRDGSLELKDIVNSIYQRQMRLLGREYRKFPYTIEGTIVKKELYYKELTRASNRQKTTMNLGGIMGSLEIKDLNKESYEVLMLGGLIGVGKQTVFGLGKIEIKDAS